MFQDGYSHTFRVSDSGFETLGFSKFCTYNFIPLYVPWCQKKILFPFKLQSQIVQDKLFTYNAHIVMINK